MATSNPGRLRFVAVCLGLIVALTAIELGVRWLRLAPQVDDQYGAYVSDADILFRKQPLSYRVGRNATDEFDYDYRHNSLGFRDVEHGFPKGKEVFRILGLGDSFTYGVGVRFEEMYLSRLQETLNKRAGIHPKVEVVRAGMPRYFPEAERLLLEKYGARFEPNLILVGFLPNDVVDTYMGLDAVKVDPSGHLKTREAEELGELGTQTYRYCHSCRVVIRRYISWRMDTNSRIRNDEIYRSEGLYEKDWLKVEREYERMAAIADSMGARLVIVHIPQRGPWSEKHRYPAARLAAWAARRNVGFVDLLPALAAAGSQQRLYYEKDGHATPAAHAIFAGKIQKYLIERRLVP
jgi:lysophospholipase L1-like esterase